MDTKKVNTEFKITYFLIAIIFALFTSTYHFSHTKPSLSYDNAQTNIILLHESEPIQNYISSEIQPNHTNQVITWRDLLPTTFAPANNFNTKIFLLENVKEFFYNIKSYSILSRYKTRVLQL